MKKGNKTKLKPFEVANSQKFKKDNIKKLPKVKEFTKL